MREPQPVRLGLADLESIVALHDQLHALLPRPGLFARETTEFFAACLAREGEIYGIKQSGRLIAYGVLGLPPRGSDYNFGGWAGLDSSRHGEVAHIDGVGVDPAYRGLGFQRRLIACRLQAAEAAGRPLVYSTAAPGNRASLVNLIDCGFVLVCQRKLFGGHDRFILRHVAGAVATVRWPEIAPAA